MKEDKLDLTSEVELEATRDSNPKAQRAKISLFEQESLNECFMVSDILFPYEDLPGKSFVIFYFADIFLDTIEHKNSINLYEYRKLKKSRSKIYTLKTKVEGIIKSNQTPAKYSKKDYQNLMKAISKLQPRLESAYHRFSPQFEATHNPIEQDFSATDITGEEIAKIRDAIKRNLRP